MHAYALPPPGDHPSPWRRAHQSAARQGSLREPAHNTTRTSARPGAGRMLARMAAAFTIGPEVLWIEKKRKRGLNRNGDQL